MTEVKKAFIAYVVFIVCILSILAIVKFNEPSIEDVELTIIE